jgi:hypothetical protein
MKLLMKKDSYRQVLYPQIRLNGDNCVVVMVNPDNIKNYHHASLKDAKRVE